MTDTALEVLRFVQENDVKFIRLAFSDLFGISQLTGLMKCAEGVSSIITAMLVSFLLMAVISISLMIFMAGGAV